MTDQKKVRLHICITVVVMLFIFIQSALSGDVSGAESNIIVRIIAGLTGWNEELLSIVVRKAAHFTEYAVLGFCLSINMRDLAASRMNKYWLIAWLIGTAYAVTDEFHQLFVPDRGPSPIDVLIDSAGVACGVLLYLLNTKNKQKS